MPENQKTMAAKPYCDCDYHVRVPCFDYNG
jgi:hypothetical protein